MLGLLFALCVVLQFHYHDPIPWYIWALAVLALLVSFGDIKAAMPARKE